VPTGFPQSDPSVQSVAFFRTAWDPSAPNSGRPLPQSQIVPLANFVPHAKNTTPRNNSDFDLTVMAWNIRHILPGPGSTQVPPSALVWATSQYEPNQADFHLPTPIPTDYPNGHWVHIPFTWHMPAGLGSNFVATLAGTAFIGIEHVPEPVTALLAGGGALLLACSWGLRKRRMAS
jgi:hypothetical protein